MPFREGNTAAPRTVDTLDGVRPDAPGTTLKIVASSDHLPRGALAGTVTPDRVGPTLRSAPGKEAKPLTPSGAGGFLPAQTNVGH